MPFYEREARILKLLEDGDELSTVELASRMFVSEPTIRRDLAVLAKKGAIIRTHGGAIIKRSVADEKIPLLFREQEQNTAKAIMGKIAASMIRDGYTIMMDATTSAFHILPHLESFKNLIVITSGAKTSYFLGRMNIKNICTGGRMIPVSLSYVGANAERTIRDYNADIVFFSCRGLSLDGRLTDNSIEENNIRRVMMKNSAKKVFLCDSTKFDKVCLHNLCTVSEIDEIISDAPLPPGIQEIMRKKLDVYEQKRGNRRLWD
jgi:DeoR family fructose operon transcriptional repressor